MNVSELIEQQFNVKTVYDINPEVSAVQITKTKVLSYNPRRVSFVLINLGSDHLLVAPDAKVSLTRGIYLVPNGGTLSMVWTEDFEMPTFEWYAIADTNPCNIMVMEVLTQ
ncbi:MAG: hypothetical protein FVQ79_12190 [Planctomycetes bacterium]|nr:hypothetical protein [Planctomycetota bacterium]